jgi:transcription termination/antitermination protein NusG
VNDVNTQSNITMSRADIIRLATTAGKEAAVGTDALPNLAQHVVQAASQKELTLACHKDDRDDATGVYAAYASARERGAKLDGGNEGNSERSRSAQISKLRQLIKMGMGPGDPVRVINHVVAAHQHALSQGTRVRPLYETMVAVARAQIKACRDLKQIEIENLVCRVSAPRAPKAPDKLAKIEALLTELIEAGEKSGEVTEARALIRRRLMVSKKPNGHEVVEAQAMRWYAVRSCSNSENDVAESIREQAKQRGLTDLFEKVIVPPKEVRRDGKVGKRKPFGGYVLVRAKLTAEVSALIKNTPKLVRGAKLMAISDEEAEHVLRAVEEPKAPAMEVGDQVRMSGGTFSGHTGPVAEVDEARSRLKVEVSMLGVTTLVPAEFGAVEKV